jgi:uncharacterized protein YjiS (DUF1127 family)
MASNHITINGLGGKVKGNNSLTKSFFGSVFTIVIEWQERASMRHSLGTLDKIYLDDMGISTQDALGEAAKPFWRK